MINTVFLIVQILLLIVSCTMLWQILRFFKRTDIADDEPLSETCVSFLKNKTIILSVCIVAGTLISILRSILNFFELL